MGSERKMESGIIVDGARRGKSGVTMNNVRREGSGVIMNSVRREGSGEEIDNKISMTGVKGGKKELVRCWVGIEDVKDEICETVQEGEMVRIIVAYYARGDVKYDLKYQLKILGKNARGEILVYGIVDDTARKTLKMQIELKNKSKGAVGIEHEDVLILSDKATSISYPEMWCDEEQIQGSHGVAVGRLDGQQIAYLATRGISEEKARQMLIHAKLWQVLGRIEDKKIREAVKRQLDSVEWKT